MPKTTLPLITAAHVQSLQMADVEQPALVSNTAGHVIVGSVFDQMPVLATRQDVDDLTDQPDYLNGLLTKTAALRVASRLNERLRMRVYAVDGRDSGKGGSGW